MIPLLPPLPLAHDIVREPEDKAAKMRRAVRANNFTQQTNALDVDKHMCVPFHPQFSLSPFLDS
jgi:hypothetical protein